MYMFHIICDDHCFAKSLKQKHPAGRGVLCVSFKGKLKLCAYRQFDFSWVTLAKVATSCRSPVSFVGHISDV